MFAAANGVFGDEITITKAKQDNPFLRITANGNFVVTNGRVLKTIVVEVVDGKNVVKSTTPGVNAPPGSAEWGAISKDLPKGLYKLRAKLVTTDNMVKDEKTTDSKIFPGVEVK
jgi:hypothetical protein